MQILVGQYALALIKPEIQGERESTSKREGETCNVERTDRMLITQVTNVALVQGCALILVKANSFYFQGLYLGNSFKYLVNIKIGD